MEYVMCQFSPLKLHPKTNWLLQRVLRNMCLRIIKITQSDNETTALYFDSNRFFFLCLYNETDLQRRKNKQIKQIKVNENC